MCKCLSVSVRQLSFSNAIVDSVRERKRLHYVTVWLHNSIFMRSLQYDLCQFCISVGFLLFKLAFAFALVMNVHMNSLLDESLGIQEEEEKVRWIFPLLFSLFQWNYGNCVIQFPTFTYSQQICIFHLLKNNKSAILIKVYFCIRVFVFFLVYFFLFKIIYQSYEMLHIVMAYEIRFAKSFGIYSVDNIVAQTLECSDQKLLKLLFKILKISREKMCFFVNKKIPIRIIFSP